MTWMAGVFCVLVVFYYYPFAVYFTRLFPVSDKRRIIAAVLMAVLLAITYGALRTHNLRILNMPVFTIMMTVGLRCMTGMNWLQSLYGGLICVLGVYCTRGTLASIGALALRQPILSDTVDLASAVMTFPVGLAVFLFLQRKVFPAAKIRILLSTRSQLKQVVAYQIAAVLNLSIMYSGRHISQHDVWYPVIALINCAMTLGVLLFAIYQSIRGTELLAYQERSQMLEQQYAQQMAHYKSYKKYTESFRVFKHDYKAMMGTTKTLLRSGKIEQAIQLIDAVYDEAQKRVQVHKKYSDHAVLDALLQDLANLCNENEIRHSFQVSALRNIRLTLLDAIRIFSNITTNAVEACLKLPPCERYIHITSSSEQQWAVLEVTNPFDGGIVLRDGLLATTKSEPEIHGLGLGIVREIAESIGGLVLYDTGADDRTFSVRLFLPQME